MCEFPVTIEDKLIHMKRLIIFSLLLTLFSCETGKKEQPVAEASRWTEEKAWAWYEKYDWLAGANFNPSTSINQLEFWQEATFDPETIDRELGWSADLGFNLHRVYLHNLLWDQDSTGISGKVGKLFDHGRQTWD